MIRTKLPTKLKDFPRAFSYLMHQTCKRRAALASRRLLPHHPPFTQSPSCSKTSATPTHLPDVLTVMRHPAPELPWPEQSPPWKFTCAGEQPLSASDVPAPIYLLLKIWPLSIYPTLLGCCLTKTSLCHLPLHLLLSPAPSPLPPHLEASHSWGKGTFVMHLLGFPLPGSHHSQSCSLWQHKQTLCNSFLNGLKTRAAT